MKQKLKRFFQSSAFVYLKLLMVWMTFAAVHSTISFGQTRNDDCMVIAFPPDKTVRVSFVAPTRFAEANGIADVKLNDKGEAEIKVKFNRLMSVHKIGGRFSAYVLWAVLPDGSTSLLGPLDINGEDKIYNVEASYRPVMGEFGLLLTAEPHERVSEPGVPVLRSAIPSGTNANRSKPREVRCEFSEKNYFRSQQKLTEREEKELRKIPLLYLGAKYAVELASDAEAESLASEMYNKAEVAKRELDSLVKMKSKREVIETSARQVIGLAVDAEKEALRRTRERRDEAQLKRQNKIVEDLRNQAERAEESKNSLENQVARLRGELSSLQEDYDRKKGQMETVEKQNGFLNERVKQLQDENYNLSIANRRMETELIRFRGAKEWLKDSPILEKHLAVFGKVQKRDDGLVLVLDESRWESPEEGKLSPASLVELDPLFSKIAEAKYLEIHISSFVAVSESSAQAKIVGDKRATTIYQQLFNKGVRSDRMKNETFLQLPDTTPTNKKVPKLNPTRIEIFVRPLGDN